MPSDRDGLLSPVTVGHDDAVADAAVLDALVEAEGALVRAYGVIGAAPAAAADALAQAWETTRLDVAAVAADAVAGGNPVIPLVAALREAAPADARIWVHRGATSQDILDSALMLVAHRATASVVTSLQRLHEALAAFASDHRDRVAAARTLTQHAVPTTIGLRATAWLRGVDRASRRLRDAREQLPAQLGGAAGTLASFVEIAGADAATGLPSAFAAELGLRAPEAPWHTTRWPVTELGDALVQTLDAVGVLAADVATLSRTEIGELAEASGGGSSAMPQKRNPAASVLIRSAALRAPQLGATLHLCAALAVDERPDGAWHAEWPTLRDLLSLALGATAHAATLVEGLRVDDAAVARNVSATGGGVLAERLSIALGPEVGAKDVARLVAGPADSVAASLAELPRVAALAAERDTTVDAVVSDLLDPARYTGLAGALVDATVAASDRARESEIAPEPDTAPAEDA